jgi:hypothetical protein
MFRPLHLLCGVPTVCLHAFPAHRVCQVKRAILSSLGIIIDKGGILLRPFLPQLQPTFVKALNDPNKVGPTALSPLPCAVPTFRTMASATPVVVAPPLVGPTRYTHKRTNTKHFIHCLTPWVQLAAPCTCARTL